MLLLSPRLIVIGHGFGEVRGDGGGHRCFFLSSFDGFKSNLK